MSGKTKAGFSIGAAALAAFLCAMPISVQSSTGSGPLSVSVRLDTAAAADLAVTPRGHYRVHRHYRIYGRLYDAFCGGPYVGGGWNGGTYWGGPFMDLRCYGLL